MYRVELKVLSKLSLKFVIRVPNVPCGVESLFDVGSALLVREFLMYRVELKAFEASSVAAAGSGS